MSTPPDKPAPEVGWETIERVAAQADARRLEAADADAVDAELHAAGINPADADRLFEEASAKVDAPRAQAGGAKPAGVTPGPGTMRSRWGIALVAAAAVLVLLLAWKRREIVALFTPGEEPIGPDRELVPEPDRALRVKWIPGRAFEACGRGEWTECQAKLDEAKRLDPAGESDPGVVKARQDIAVGLGVELPDGGDGKK